MKTASLLLLALVVSGFSARGQVTLHAGESWSYQFDSLPSLNVPLVPFNQAGGLLTFSVSSVQPGTTMRYEMFEDGFGQPPVSLLHYPGSQAAFVAGAWQDQDGSVRLTMLGGALTLQSVTVQAAFPVAGGGFSFRGARIVPEVVPEPGVCGLVACGALGAMVWARRRRG